MAHGTCIKTGCAVAETGICLLSHSPIQLCPNHSSKASLPDEKGTVASQPGSPRLNEPTVPMPVNGGRNFHTGLELGSDDALEISRAHYCHLIGIIGAGNAGKTCYLLSLYLMAARGDLPGGYRFAGSLSLKGFEDRARRLRSWKGGPLPAQLADHTSLTDTRQAALLHLALRKGATGRRVNLLLTDLPGEWTRTLVDHASTADRFTFLKRADGIVLVIDGPALLSSRRHVEVQRTKHLLDRLKDSVGVIPTVPMTLLISKGDAIKMQPPTTADELVRHAKSLGFQSQLVVSASFSYDAAIPSGTGVFEAINPMIAPATQIPLRYDEALPSDARRFASFGRVSQ